MNSLKLFIVAVHNFIITVIQLAILKHNAIEIIIKLNTPNNYSKLYNHTNGLQTIFDSKNSSSVSRLY